MLRLTDLKLPLGHSDGAIRAALLKRLRIPERDEVPIICETQTVVEFYSR